MASSLLSEVEDVLHRTRSDAADRLQLPDILVTTAVCLAVAVAAAVPAFVFLSGSVMLYIGALVVSVALGFVVARRSPVGAPLALLYCAFLGAVAGGFTGSAVNAGGGFALVGQAIIGTSVGAVAVLAVSTTRVGRRAGRSLRLFMAIGFGYFLLSIASFVAALFGVGSGWGFYGVSGLGLLLCAAGVAFACWNFLVQITSASDAIAGGVPMQWRWSFGMAIASSLVWMYVEILRLLAIASRQ